MASGPFVLSLYTIDVMNNILIMLAFILEDGILAELGMTDGLGNNYISTYLLFSQNFLIKVNYA